MKDNWPSVLVFAATVLSMLLCFYWFPFESRDYEIFLRPWFEELKANGGFLAVGRLIGDYLPPYLYLLAGLTYFPVDSLFSIKFVSCIADYVLALYALKIVAHASNRTSLAVVAYTVILFLPTVVLNNAACHVVPKAMDCSSCRCILFIPGLWDVPV